MLVFGGVAWALASISDERALAGEHSTSERLDPNSVAATNADIFRSCAIPMVSSSIAGQLSLTSIGGASKWKTPHPRPPVPRGRSGPQGIDNLRPPPISGMMGNALAPQTNPSTEILD